MGFLKAGGRVEDSSVGLDYSSTHDQLASNTARPPGTIDTTGGSEPQLASNFSRSKTRLPQMFGRGKVQKIGHQPNSHTGARRQSGLAAIYEKLHQQRAEQHSAELQNPFIILSGENSECEIVEIVYVDHCETTPLPSLAYALRPLAKRLLPSRGLIETGSCGRCGPNSLTFLLNAAGKFMGCGDLLRTEVIEHARAQLAANVILSSSPDGRPIHAEELLTAAILTWPDDTHTGITPSGSAWCDIMSLPTTWIDHVFLQIASDLFNARIIVHGVDDLGSERHGGAILPLGDSQPIIELELALWCQHHFVAVAHIRQEASEESPASLLIPSHSNTVNPLSEVQPAYADTYGGSTKKLLSVVEEFPDARKITEPSDTLLPQFLTSQGEICAPPFKETSVTTLDIREATDAASLIIFISVVAQPLIYAHVNGYTIIGFESPLRASRHQCIASVQLMIDLCQSALCYAFMAGEYTCGARLFAAPLAEAPIATSVCRTVSQRKSLILAGATFAWCTLAALGDTAVGDAAARSVLATQMFRQPISVLPTKDLGFRSGAAPITNVLRRPTLIHENHPAAWSTLLHAVESDRLLASALHEAGDDPLLSEWREQIKPIPVDQIPASLLTTLPDFDDPALDYVTLSEVPPPLSTSWMPLPPIQQPPIDSAPACPRSVSDLMPESTRLIVKAWLQNTLDDLLSIQSGLSIGILPDNLIRHRPKPLAIGQGQLHEWARGRVWDCRLLTTSCCVLVDFHAPINTHLNLEILASRLERYPDQTLVANLLEGVRLDADVELQTVLVPHLVSLAKGFASVEKEIRRLRNLNWYDFFDDFPFWPMYLNGQGATSRKLEPDRFRRTTEGGGPRTEVFDSDGVRALSINEASRIYHFPVHFANDTRPEMLSWLRARSLPHSRPLSVEEVKLQSKWPKERKPLLEELMRDLAVLSRAARVLGEPIYVFGDDAKDYFNQLAMASSELHKMGIVLLAEDEDNIADTSSTITPSRGGVKLIFISELRLGFGTHGASNIAQRFSNALLSMFRTDMDESEDLHQRHNKDTRTDQWKIMRQGVQLKTGVPCHNTRRWEQSKLKGIEVCPQLRLYSAFMYTDDPIFLMVGVDRALRALKIWRQLTTSICLIMAIATKRFLGSWCVWLGVLIIASIGLVIIPIDKLLRASATITTVLTSGCEFHTYRSLCGLLEHFRAVNLKGRNVMHGLYEPHSANGASSFGPSGRVTCELGSLMSKQLQRWQTLLSQSAGVSVKVALSRHELEPNPDIKFVIDSDAFYEHKSSGMGGYLQGYFWHFEPPTSDLDILNAPILEFLALCFNYLIFHSLVVGIIKGNPEAFALFRTDALTTALTLPAESQNSPLLVAAFHWICERQEFKELAPQSQICHIFGDNNVFGDAVSRRHWVKFHQLCLQVGVKPTPLPVPLSAVELYTFVINAARNPLNINWRAGSLEANSTSVFFQRVLKQRAASNPAGREEQLEINSGAAPHFASGSDPQFASGSDPQFLSKYSITQRCSTFVSIPRARFFNNSSIPSKQSSPQLKPSEIQIPKSVHSYSVGGSSPQLTLAVRSRLADRHLLAPSLQTPQTSLSLASKNLAMRRALTLSGNDDMALKSPSLLFISQTIDNYVEYGVNANTLKKDNSAWLLWEDVCAQQGTTPMRSAEDVRDHPQRSTHLLTVLLLHASAVCVPRIKDRAMVKPKSALAYPLAIVRIFKRWGIIMPNLKSVIACMHGLMRQYLDYHGPGSLAPKRAEPMKFCMMADMFYIPQNTRFSKLIWSDYYIDVFMFRRLNVFLMSTAFRLAEICAHSSGEIMYLTRASLTWNIHGMVVMDPTLDQLRSLRPGLDTASITPPRSKPDQWGEVHCAFPVYLTYREANRPQMPNPAAALRDIEIRFPCHGIERATRPLFADINNQPYKHHVLGRLLHAALLFLYGAKVADIFTFHSYRSGLACALHAAKVPDDMIMLICRWMCEESLHAYRRMGSKEHENHILRASLTNIELLQTTNVPIVAGDQGYAALALSVQGRQGRDIQTEYEEAVLNLSGLSTLTPQLNTSVTVKRPRLQSNLSSYEKPVTSTVISIIPTTVYVVGSFLNKRPYKSTHVLVPKEIYPNEDCYEYNGIGWEATVVTSNSLSALLHFVQARDSLNLPYHDVRLGWRSLISLNPQ